MPLRANLTSALSAIVLAGMAGLSLPVDAHATGGLSCQVDDGNISLDVEAGFSYGGSGGLFGVRGDMSLKSADLPSELARRVINQDMLVQQWLDGKDLRLKLYAETTGNGPFASVMVTIVTEQSTDDELTFEGTYDLKMQLPAPRSDGSADIVEQTGKVSCSVG